MAAIRRQPLTTGQAGEWLVWTHLALQSGGDLHVFLPGLDRGIDGFVRRLSTDAHIPVQVKARTTITGRRVAFQLTEPELANPSIQVIVVHLDPWTATLAPQVLVADAATIRAAAHWMPRSRMFSISVPLAPTIDSPWAGRWVSLDELGERLSPSNPMLTAARPQEPIEQRQRHGYQAELTLVAACAARPPLNIFRAAPDCEFIEYLVYHVDSHDVVGLQVKSISIPAGATHGAVRIHRPSFRASPHAYLVAIAMARQDGEVLDECLLIPSAAVPAVATSMTASRIEIKWHPHGRGSRLDPYRVPLRDLGARIEWLLHTTPHLG